MQSWRLLQLEPSALRAPDSFTAPAHLEASGSHLPATLYHLAGSAGGRDADTREEAAQQVYASVANRLAELINDVRDLRVERDDRRQLLTLYVTDQYGTAHPARALSDGTLRFLALAVLELDPRGQGLLCLEEPENGIHPQRIPAMLKLLRDLAVDVDEDVDPDNPLRQVIVNTHSPVVVGQVDADELVVAESAEAVRGGTRFSTVRFLWLPDTWRARADPDPHKLADKGNLLTYLNPTIPETVAANGSERDSRVKGARRRVVDRPDLQPFLWAPALLEEIRPQGE